MIIYFLLLLFSKGEIRIGVQIFTNSRAGVPNVHDLFRNVFRPSMNSFEKELKGFDHVF